MKRLIIMTAVLGLCFNGKAQEKYVVSATVALQNNKLDEAKENIDKAMANAETSEKPKTLFVKGETYLALQTSDKYKASNPYREGAQALFKLVDIKPEYEKETVDGLLMNAFVLYYNDGVKAYNDKKYADAAEDMKNVTKIYNMGSGGKRFDKIPPALQKKGDTAAADANQIIANCAYYNGQYEEAIPLLVAVKNNPITRNATIYAILIDAYNHQKKTTEALAVIQEGRKLFPDDATLRTDELNYYINSGKDDEIIKKLEDAAVKDPKNADLQFNIATTYLNMARPKSGPRPANAAELYGKAEDAYKKALGLDPHNEVYNYNFGSMYYNQAADVNEQMNAINGTSDADQKKYDDLKAQRDALFAKAAPFFEDAYNQYSAKESSLKGEDKDTYKNTVRALKELYARQGKMDKSADMKKKLETL